jgi:undecaprenyl diphosphate synthase
MNLIQHVAIIMDGNGRWGIKKKRSRNYGHQQGLKSVEIIIKQTIREKIKFLTLYAFSTENWKRPKSEINFLLKLLENYLVNKIDYLNKNGIKLKVIGNINIFSVKLKKILNRSQKITKKNNKLQINLALNYGAKKELLSAFKTIKKNKQKISEECISSNLFTKRVPDPDILIRTGNTHRLSNFLLWQIAYTEIFFVKKLWPDFKVSDYKKIIFEFKNTKRNFGNVQ